MRIGKYCMGDCIQIADNVVGMITDTEEIFACDNNIYYHYELTLIDKKTKRKYYERENSEMEIFLKTAWWSDNELDFLSKYGYKVYRKYEDEYYKKEYQRLKNN